MPGEDRPAPGRSRTGTAPRRPGLEGSLPSSLSDVGERLEQADGADPVRAVAVPGSGRAACARRRSAPGRSRRRPAKITIDLTIRIQVASAKLASASGMTVIGAGSSTLVISTASAPSSTLALFVAVPSIRNAAPGRIRSRSDDPARARSTRSTAPSTSSPSRDAEPLGVGGRELERLLGSEEPQRRRCARLPRRPRGRGRCRGEARRRRGRRAASAAESSRARRRARRRREPTGGRLALLPADAQCRRSRPG